MTEPERFREVEPITVDSEECANGESGVYLRVGGLLLDAAEARALRDWLARVLPAEPDARDAEIERLRLRLKDLGRGIHEERTRWAEEENWR